LAITELQVTLTHATVERIQAELRARALGGWLLYNFHGNNPAASTLLGLPALTRRYAVLIRVEGPPVALVHRIELQPWVSWIGERIPYSGWRELEDGLASILSGIDTVAMEYSPDDAVPYVDLVPAGVVDLVRKSGVEIRSSGELLSAFYARWSIEQAQSHRRAAMAVQETARAAFDLIAGAVRSGDRVREWDVRNWLREELSRRGVGVQCDSIVAVDANAANPHYAPGPDGSATIQEGVLVLIDLWGKEAEDALFADQTWMGYVGSSVPERLRAIWSAVREAREAAVELLLARHAAGEATRGWEVDDAARSVIRTHGFGEFFIHRTGHSLGRELHDSGPNIDNFETRDTRELIAGVGFSIEPGIYLPGDVGFRSEINVFMGPGGPEVTTPEPQQEVFALL
jgi:Xaa-Pro dipeptidase